MVTPKVFPALAVRAGRAACVRCRRKLRPRVRGQMAFGCRIVGLTRRELLLQKQVALLRHFGGDGAHAGRQQCGCSQEKISMMAGRRYSKFWQKGGANG